MQYMSAILDFDEWHDLHDPPSPHFTSAIHYGMSEAEIGLSAFSLRHRLYLVAT